MTKVIFYHRIPFTQLRGICIREPALSSKLFRGQDLHAEYIRKRKFTFPEELLHIRVRVKRI